MYRRKIRAGADVNKGVLDKKNSIPKYLKVKTALWD